MASTSFTSRIKSISSHIHFNNVSKLFRTKSNFIANKPPVLRLSTAQPGQDDPSKKLVIVEKIQMSHIVTTIAINRPEKRNCVNHATAIELEKAFKEFEEDPESHVAILYGKGGTFCAGYDLSEVGEGNAEVLGSDNFNPFNTKGVGPMGPSRRYFKKPVIAAIQGYAVAGGLELALMCDVRIVEDTAIMGVFCRRFGVPLIDGGTVRLPRLIGMSRAMDMILTGRAVKGKEAFEIGLANMIVACGTAIGQAVQYGNQIAKFPQECLNRDRLSAYNAMYDAKDFESAVQYEMQKGIDVLANESVAGAKNFVDGIGRHGSFNLRVNQKSKDEETKSKL